MDYISVDVETAGPTPGDFPLLSIGACLVGEPERSFYVELKPDREEMEPSAVEISGLDPDILKRDGTPPGEAMQAFARWLEQISPEGDDLVFVAFNAAFDWMYIAEYFHRYLGHNPFGHRALDIKALYMGHFGVPWHETGMNQVAKSLGLPIQLTHNALSDAIDQANLFAKLMQRIQKDKENDE